MKILLPLLFIAFMITPVYADQALVLTEIEQIQEKIWYLQRDVAAQKTAFEKYQEEIRAADKTGADKSAAIEQRLDALAKLLNSQHDQAAQLEENLQSLKEAVAALVNEFNQQNTAQLQQAERTGTQEGLLQALRDELAASRTRTEQALQETEKQLAETRAQLSALQNTNKGGYDQMGLYLGGAALALAIILTIAFAVLNSKSNRGQRQPGKRTDHEM